MLVIFKKKIFFLFSLIEPKQDFVPKVWKDKRGLRKYAAMAETTNRFPKGRRIISYVGRNLQLRLLSFLFSLFQLPPPCAIKKIGLSGALSF